jgi:hypothetical protein
MGWEGEINVGPVGAKSINPPLMSHMCVFYGFSPNTPPVRKKIMKEGKKEIKRTHFHRHALWKEIIVCSFFI